MKLIACVDLDFNIGYQNQLLFHIPEDMKRFRDYTNGNIVVMGGKTFESIGHPLKNRTNIIISHEPSKYQLDVINDVMPMTMETFINEYYFSRSSFTKEKIYVIGGAEIYNSLLPMCDTLILTRVNTVAENTDSYIKNLVYDYGTDISSSNMKLTYHDSDKTIAYELIESELGRYSIDANEYYDFLTYKLMDYNIKDAN